MTQYYKSTGENSEYIVTLEIPNDAKTNLERKAVANSKYAKYRCSKALVVDIEHKKTKKKKDCVRSTFTANFVYKTGDVVTELFFDCNLEKVCTHGIHFFKTKEQALVYYTYYTKPKNGEYKLWYDNGQLNIECVYKDGKLEGEYKSWHYFGQLNVECVYKDGKLEGDYKWH